jgi:uncharacterized protein (DUF2062 family)
MFIMTGYNSHIAERLKTVWRMVSIPVVNRRQTIMKSGLTPRKLALTLCIGTALGIMPLLWGTSLICIVLAHMFRLNHLALQSVNYLFYPMQIVLLVPFCKLGARLFPWGPPVPPDMFSVFLRCPELSAVNILVWVMLKSLTAWLVTVLPAALVAYGILRAITGRDTPRIPEP